MGMIDNVRSEMVAAMKNMDKERSGFGRVAPRRYRPDPQPGDGQLPVEKLSREARAQPGPGNQRPELVGQGLLWLGRLRRLGNQALGLLLFLLFLLGRRFFGGLGGLFGLRLFPFFPGQGLFGQDSQLQKGQRELQLHPVVPAKHHAHGNAADQQQDAQNDQRHLHGLSPSGGVSRSPAGSGFASPPAWASSSGAVEKTTFSISGRSARDSRPKVRRKSGVVR